MDMEKTPRGCCGTPCKGGCSRHGPARTRSARQQHPHMHTAPCAAQQQVAAAASPLFPHTRTLNAASSDALRPATRSYSSRAAPPAAISCASCASCARSASA